MIHRLRWIADVSTGPSRTPESFRAGALAGVVETTPWPGTIDTEQDRIGIYSWRGFSFVIALRRPGGARRWTRLTSSARVAVACSPTSSTVTEAVPLPAGRRPRRTCRPGGRHPQAAGDQAGVGLAATGTRRPVLAGVVQPLDHGVEGRGQGRVRGRRDGQGERHDPRRALGAELDLDLDGAVLPGQPPAAVGRGVGLGRAGGVGGEVADALADQADRVAALVVGAVLGDVLGEQRVGGLVVPVGQQVVDLLLGGEGLRPGSAWLARRSRAPGRPGTRSRPGPGRRGPGR